MLSLNHITKGTAVALALGAIAAPVATAGPNADQLATQVRHVHPVSVSKQVSPAAPLAYARQDKQLAPRNAPSLPSQGPIVPAAPRAATPGSSFDWGDAGIGAAGGVVLSIIGIGGGLALTQRRTRRIGDAAVATG